jgi:uncharacterized protein YkwD
MTNRIVLRNCVGSLLVVATVFLAISSAWISRPVPLGEAASSPETDFLSLLNSYRAQNGSGPLTVDYTMASAADWMGKDMATYRYFGHEPDSLGRTYAERIFAAAPSGFLAYGENIAFGFDSASPVFQAWRDSPSHNQNMLNGGFNAIGIARVWGPCPAKTLACPAGTNGWYWVTEFGTAAVIGPIVNPGPILGDVDCSQDLAVFDAVTVLLSLAISRGMPCGSVADFNLDGSVTTADAVGIESNLAGTG